MNNLPGDRIPGKGRLKMYTAFYGMKEKPFQISTDPRFLWLGEKHREALANLKYGLLDRNGFVVLTGDVGTGKTTLVNALIDALDESVLVAKINHPSLDTGQFLALIAKTLEPEIGSTDKSDLLIFFNRYLKRAYEDGKVVLLIIDEAHRLSVEVLEEIRLLSNIEYAGQKLLSIFFVGQDEIKPMLQTPECRALRQRITSLYDIDALLPEETRQYVDYRLKVSGTTEPLFTTEALQIIHALSGGNPRVINTLCDRALLTGYVKEQRVIDTDIAIECGQELELITATGGIKAPTTGSDILGKGRTAARRLKTGASTAGSTLKTTLVRLGTGCREILNRWFSRIRARFAAVARAAGPLVRGYSLRWVPVAMVLGVAIFTVAAAVGVFSGTGDSRGLPSATLPQAANPDEQAAVDRSPRDADAASLPRPPEAEPVPAQTEENAGQEASPPVAPAVQPPTEVEQAAAALAGNNYQRAVELLEARPMGAADEQADGSGVYAKALVGRAGELMADSPLEAEAMLVKATEVAPMMVEPYLILGKRYLRVKDYPKAVEAYQRAVELDRKAPDAFFNLGFIYANTGRYAAAESAFKRVVSLKPDYVDKSLFNLAVVQQKLGKKAQSIANLEEVVAMRPENEKALAYLNQLRQSGINDRMEQTR